MASVLWEEYDFFDKGMGLAGGGPEGGFLVYLVQQPGTIPSPPGPCPQSVPTPANAFRGVPPFSLGPHASLSFSVLLPRSVRLHSLSLFSLSPHSPHVPLLLSIYFCFFSVPSSTFSLALSLPFVCVCPSCVFPFVCGSDPVSRYLLLCPIPAVFVSSFSSFSHSQVLFFQTLEIIHCHPQGAQWIKCLNQTRTAREASSRKRASQGE